MRMVWFDYLILGILLVSIALGVLRGLVREVFSLLLWVLGVIVAVHYAGPAAALFGGFIQTPSLRVVAAFLFLFFFTVLVGNLVAMLLQAILDKAGLSALDRSLGGVFGLLRAVLIAGVLVLLAQSTAMARDPWWHKSVMVPIFTPVAVKLYNYLPTSLSKHLRPNPQPESL